MKKFLETACFELRLSKGTVENVIYGNVVKEIWPWFPDFFILKFYILKRAWDFDAGISYTGISLFSYCFEIPGKQTIQVALLTVCWNLS